jgi:hypothetical protein
MATKRYSASERGGGSGETGRRRAAILNHISTWWIQATWNDQERADRVFEKMQEAPEEYITPEPGADYQEEAKRCYEAIKDEYGLRTDREAEREAKVWEEREERYIRRKKRQMREEPVETTDPDMGPDAGAAPEPAAEPGSDSDPSSAPEPAAEPAGATDEAVREAVEAAEAVDEAPAADSDHRPVEAMSTPELVARLVGRKAAAAGREVGRTAAVLGEAAAFLARNPTAASGA